MISTRMLGAKPQAAEATAKITTPIRKTKRRPNLSPRAPPTRIREDRKIPYDSITHCTSMTVARNALWNFGAATLMTVLSMKAMLDPRIVAARIHRPDFAAGAVRLSELINQDPRLALCPLDVVCSWCAAIWANSLYRYREGYAGRP